MMEAIRDICSGCGKLTLIQNKTHWLCSDCVFRRNHGGKNKEEVYKERHDKKESKRIALKKEVPEEKPALIEKLKKTFSIKQISNKRAIVEAELKKVYRKIDQEREPVCEG